jgi:hypothetical protein
MNEETKEESFQEVTEESDLQNYVQLRKKYAEIWRRLMDE